MLTAAKIANLALAFALELGVLAATGWWGWTTSSRGPVKLAACLAAVVVMATLWAVFGAPKAVVPLGRWSHVGFAVLWFGAGALAVALRDRPSWAVGFFALFVLNTALAILWDQ